MSSPFVPRDPADESEWPKDLDHFSANSVSTFIRCPEQWRQVYGLGKRKRPAAVTIWGRADHQTIGEDFGHKIETEEHLPLDVFQDKFVDTFAYELQNEGGVEEIDFDEKDKPRLSTGDRQKKIAQMLDAGVTLVTKYREHIGQKIVPTRTEERFTIDVEGVPVPVIGYIDLRGRWLGGQERIIERKTVGRKETKPKSDWRTQGHLYQRVTGLPIEWQQSVRNLTASKQFVVPGSGEMLMDFNPVQAQLAEYRLSMACRQIAHLWRLYGPEHPWPDAIQHPWACNYCGFRPDCYWWQK